MTDAAISSEALDGLTMIRPELDFDDLAENFELFDEWEDRYAYVIDLGKKLPAFPQAAQTEGHKVRGCMSQVWMVPGRDTENPEQLYFAADSDATIVKGLIAVLAVLYAGKTVAEIDAIDAEAEFARLGLDSHLSPSRRNGLFSMVERIRSFAKAQD